jgi:hypothetical protein
VHDTLFPEQPLDWQREIEILAATRWPTLVSLAQFHDLTGESSWPDNLASWVRRDMLEYFCNGRVDYQVRGIHVRLKVRWEWHAEQGDDTHHALYRGTRSRLAVRQGAVERFRPELYVLPDEDISAALERRIAALQASYPGIGVEVRGSGWRIPIPDALRIGHDAAFAAFASLFLAQVVDPESVPARERPNLLAKIPGDDRCCRIEPPLSIPYQVRVHLAHQSFSGIERAHAGAQALAPDQPADECQMHSG